MTERILDRVRKMLALANDSAATEHERDTALQMAYKTLAHHNLAMVDVDARTMAKDDPRDEFNQAGYSMLWAKFANQAVAELFFCTYFYGQKINGTQCKHHFVGRESNATTAMLMSTYIVTSILKECRKNFGGSITSPSARSFALGVVNRLRSRIKEMIKAQEVEASIKTPGNSLVLANLYATEKSANEIALRDKGIGLKSSKHNGKGVNDSSAYHAGRDFGDKINLSPQIGNSTNSTKQIK